MTGAWFTRAPAARWRRGAALAALSPSLPASVEPGRQGRRRRVAPHCSSGELGSAPLAFPRSRRWLPRTSRVPAESQRFVRHRRQAPTANLRCGAARRGIGQRQSSRTRTICGFVRTNRGGVSEPSSADCERAYASPFRDPLCLLTFVALCVPV